MYVVSDYRICSMMRNVVRTIKNFNVNEEALVKFEYLFWLILVLRRSQGSVVDIQ